MEQQLPDEPDSRSMLPAGRQGRHHLEQLPKDELIHLAEEFGVDHLLYETQQDLVSALHQRRQLIAAMDRDAMLDVIKWGRRPVTANASQEQLAQEIARITSMRFGGLSQRGLVVLGMMRGLRLTGSESVPELVRLLKRQEGLFAKLNRKRRAMLGSIVSNLLGDKHNEDYKFLPPPDGAGAGPSSKPRSLKHEIEESGLFSGIAGRIKRSADSYVNQKLDEIEARIDRKLDEIDRRLAEWRDKEIANRIRILKITLWASVIVAVVSLLYSYLKIYLSFFKR